MTGPARILATVVAAVLAVTVAGCGVGEGDADPGTATLTVTRDYGAEPLLDATLDDPPSAQTVVRFLDAEADVETSYGDNFVDSIDGISGRIEAGRSEDWFFYVNGYWSPIGAGEATVRAGDRIWWDYRDWTDAYRVSAVVGSWPEPFLHGSDGERPPTEVVCFDSEPACTEVADRLRDAGVEPSEVDPEAASDPEQALRVFVGSWDELRSDRLARDLERGPQVSGVYARPVRCDAGYGLELLDDHAEVRAVSADAAWVAAVGAEGSQPTWLLSGTNSEQVTRAAGLLSSEELADRYAVAVAGDGEPQALPVAADSESQPQSAHGEGCR